jgi:3-hydroxybenzoate 6-monooxygenase
MSNWKDQQVVIVGGGIGGLAAALALARKGIPSQVIEQAPEFKEIGAGIQLGPNVFWMFESSAWSSRSANSRCFRTT